MVLCHIHLKRDQEFQLLQGARKKNGVPKFKGWPKEVLPSGDLKFKVAAVTPKDTM